MSFSHSMTGSKRLLDADRPAIRIAAMDMLARREHSHKELLFKLLDRGAEESLALEVLQDLRSENLQSDLRFMEMLLHSSLGRGRGPVRIQQELQQHGIDEAKIELFLEDNSVDWEVLARQVYEKKYGDSAEDDYNERAKRMRFLQSRGFSSSQIQSVIR